MQRLREYFNGFGTISSENMDYLLSHCKSLEVPKGTELIKPNQDVDAVYFLEEGFLHYYTYSDFGERITLKIVEANYCWTMMDSFVNQVPSSDYCVALSPVRFCELKRDSYLAIKSRNKELSNFIQSIVEQILSAKVIETNKKSRMTIEQRYLDLLENHTKMVQEVPVQILASLIGTSRETLHRIRRKLAAA
ncbi:Crp/Fnr family transcriptional regulator [Flagellimonas sp. S174]|uniref:Crp/Fnr family transcriptional regulator n=1 Tax=Flagellimonas sp. S174 TaxID=3410790 RepID=UPI003BF5D1BA